MVPSGNFILSRLGDDMSSSTRGKPERALKRAQSQVSLLSRSAARQEAESVLFAREDQEVYSCELPDRPLMTDRPK